MRARNTREKRRDALLTAFILLVSFVVLSPLLLALLNSFKGLSEITHDVGSLPPRYRDSSRWFPSCGRGHRR
mgnify:CR=1 FL=1